MGSVQSRLDASGVQFRKGLTSADVDQIRLARNIFLTVNVVPILLYYMRTSEAKPKFPATISFCIRKGIPKYAHNLIWLAGWAAMYNVIHRRGGKFEKLFAVQMIMTGIITVFICALGQGALSDKIHFYGAGLYMVDHYVLFKLLATKPVFRAAFWGSFLLMLAALRQERTIFKHAETDFEGKEKQLAKLTPAERRLLWWWQFWTMFFENTLFVAFVGGMNSGLHQLSGKV